MDNEWLKFGIVGVRLQKATLEWDYLIVFRMDYDHGEDAPLLDDGYILLFPDVHKCLNTLEAQVGNVASLVHSPIPSFVMDIPGAIDLLRNGNVDPSATVINFLNTMFDLVRATGFSIPPAYKEHLYSLANHLTFERSINVFFDTSDISRDDAINAVLWMLGAVSLHCKIAD